MSLQPPISRIPNEILGEVFSLACQRGWWYPEEEPIKKTYTALVVSQVCQDWRQFANDTPELWSTLNLSWQMNSIDADVSSVFLLYLDRSKDHSLYVLIDVSDYVWTPSEHVMIGALMANSSRFRKLTVKDKDLVAIQNQITETSPNFTRLESLELPTEIDVLDGPNEHPQWFSNAPNLKKLLLRAPLDYCSFNWSTIEQLDFQFSFQTSTQDYLDVFKRLSCQAPSLVTFKISSNTHTHIQTTQTFRFDMLESMRFGPALTTAIVAPMLRHLDVSSHYLDVSLHSCPKYAEDVYKFLVQSDAQLISFAVNASFFSDTKHCALCLASLPNLAKFQVTRAENFEALTSQLCLPYNETTLLPQLEEFSLSYEPSGTGTLQQITPDLVEFLESRCHAKGSQFARFNLDYWNWSTDDVIGFKCTKELEGRLQRLYDDIYMCINGNDTPVPVMVTED